MKKLPLAAVALLCALPCSAQVSVEGMDVPASVKDSIKQFKDERAPAPIDRKPVDELFERLSDRWKTGGALSGVSPIKDGSLETMTVELVEVDGPQPQGNVIDLVERRYFTEIDAESDAWSDLANDEVKVVAWRFRIGLDGTILSAEKETRIGKLVDANRGVEGVKPDRKGRLVETKRPKDPAVLAKWKELAPKLCALRPTQAV